MSIPFIDLQAQYHLLERDIRAGIERVLAHGQFIMGPEVEELERRLADYVGVRHAVSCSSGTDALLMPLMAWGVGPGDAVFTTPCTFIATAEVVGLLGATPVFVDIDSRTFNLDPARLKAAVARVRSEGRLRPRGVIPVDLFGLPADYDEIARVAAGDGLLILEDAAQSFGAQYKGRRAGALAPVGATSFFPAKPLGCYGDGGAVFTDDDALAEVLRSIRIHGKGSDKYDNVRVGINGRLDTLQAAILLSKLDVFPHELEARQRVAKRYDDILAGMAETQFVPDGYLSAWAQYSILLRDKGERMALQGALKKDGIPTAVYYPKPLHLQGAFAALGCKEGDFPVTESVSRRIVSLPMHPYLVDEEVDRIGASVRKTLSQFREEG